MLDTIAYGSVATPRGLVHLAASARGLVAVTLPGERVAALLATVRARVGAAPIRRVPAAVAAAAAQIAEYFAGGRRDFDLPLDLREPPFTRAVLEALRRIPYGETRSYGDIARAVRRPRGARAVGQACGRNPVPIVIPCHRVLAAGGALGGFGGGVAMKTYLLALERGATPR
jgi:methylated-DNA-[protein]-cysteine S-methyltransferase